MSNPNKIEKYLTEGKHDLDKSQRIAKLYKDNYNKEQKQKAILLKKLNKVCSLLNSFEKNIIKPLPTEDLEEGDPRIIVRKKKLTPSQIFQRLPRPLVTHHTSLNSQNHQQWQIQNDQITTQNVQNEEETETSPVLNETPESIVELNEDFQ